jgi:hypothetical protein
MRNGGSRVDLFPDRRYGGHFAREKERRLRSQARECAPVAAVRPYMDVLRHPS